MKKQNLFLWTAFNLILPLAPVAIKILITVFGDSQKISVTILESVELLYYNFIICVIGLYELIKKNNKTGIEYWIEFGAAFIILTDIVLLMLIYGRQESTDRIRVASLIISILVPIASFVKKRYDFAHVEKSEVRS